MHNKTFGELMSGVDEGVYFIDTDKHISNRVSVGP